MSRGKERVLTGFGTNANANPIKISQAINGRGVEGGSHPANGAKP